MARRSGMRRHVAGACLAAGLLVCSAAGRAEDLSDLRAEGQRIATGGGPAESQPCMACHGADGMGDSAAGFPRLAGLNARYLDKQMEDYVSGARANAIMTPIASALDRTQREAVAAYYAGLEPRAPAWRSREADAAQVQHGAVLWAQGRAGQIQACVNCHGAAGARGWGAVYPDLAGQPRTYTEAQFQAFRNGERQNDQSSMMRVIAARMDEADVAAIAAFLAQLEPR
jgi:cytochrome c553